ncbi:hypothetical protein DYI26_09150 [Halomonas litopenaei]|nr:hypothetical protein [Halomonas litopenaei]
MPAPMEIMSFYSQDMQQADPDSVYDLWLGYHDAIKNIDPVFNHWFYISKATPKEVVYLDVSQDREQILAHALQDYPNRITTPREKMIGIRLHAWSQEVPATGPANDDEASLISSSTITGGRDFRPANFFLEVEALQSSRGDDELATFVKLCTAISNVQKPSWLSVSPSSYIDYAVFPHRESVGWMALVPDVNISGELPFLAYDEYLPGIGTLLVTTKDRFKTINESHLEASQATEIALNEMGLLPER